jgi:hypothetical protein
LKIVKVEKGSNSSASTTYYLTTENLNFRSVGADSITSLLEMYSKLFSDTNRGIEYILSDSGYTVTDVVHFPSDLTEPELLPYVTTNHPELLL